MPQFVKAHSRCAVKLPVLIIALLIVGGCGGTGSQRQQGAQHPGVGQALMYLELEPLTGDSVPMTKQSLAGRVTLLNFWATWCGPCKNEAPHLAALSKKLNSESKFQFLSVNTDDEPLAEAEELAKKFQLEQGVSNPTWADPNARTWQSAARQFQTTSIPFTVVIDTQGIVRGIWIGYVRGDEVAMEKLARDLLAIR
jgi:thiol-disulfide isomerase/thioredoxin